MGNITDKLTEDKEEISDKPEVGHDNPEVITNDENDNTDPGKESDGAGKEIQETESSKFTETKDVDELELDELATDVTDISGDEPEVETVLKNGCVTYEDLAIEDENLDEVSLGVASEAETLELSYDQKTISDTSISQAGITTPTQPLHSMDDFADQEVDTEAIKAEVLNRTPGKRAFTDYTWNALLKDKPPDSQFEYIRSEGVSRGILYQDPDFPAHKSSLYYKKKPKLSPLVWRRPTEMRPHPKFFDNGATRFDVVQGMLGDSWLLAGLGALTLTPGLLERCIPEEQGFDEGKYAGLFHFRFWRNGEWVDVIIDDLLPTYKGELVYLHSSDPDCFWTALLEKAYAKLYGSYEAIQNGYMGWALQDLTGGVIEKFNIRLNAALCRQVLEVGMSRASLMSVAVTLPRSSTARTIPDPKGRSMIRRLQNGLITGHPYSITGMAKIPLHGGILLLVRLRCPWGAVEWNGAWCDGSPQWATIGGDDRDRMQGEAGEFWMSLDDFLNMFTNLEIVHLGPESWHIDPYVNIKNIWQLAKGRKHWRRGFNAGGGLKSEIVHVNPQFKVTLKEDSCVVVSVMQSYKAPRKKKQFISCASLLYRVTDPLKSTRYGKQFFQKNAPVSTPPFGSSRDHVTFLTLAAGTYMLVPITEFVNTEAKFVIRVLTENEGQVMELDDPDDRYDMKQGGIMNGTRPVITKEDQKMHRYFFRYADKETELNMHALRKVLKRGFMLNKPGTPICCQTNESEKLKMVTLPLCQSLIALRDDNMNGRMGLQEFTKAWQQFKLWRDVFREFQGDDMGRMNSYVMRDALSAVGFSVSNKCLEAIILRFSRNWAFDFEAFVLAVIKLHIAHDKFIEIQSSDEPSKTLEFRDVVQMVIYS